jgi:hypothetical protein
LASLLRDKYGVCVGKTDVRTSRSATTTVMVPAVVYAHIVMGASKKVSTEGGALEWSA